MPYNDYVRQFLANDNGSTSIEFLLWVPVMVLFLTMTTDATLLMHTQQTITNHARDTSRQVALGQKTTEEAQEQLFQRYSSESHPPQVVVENGFVTTTISVPFSDVAKISKLFLTGDLSANVSMWVENAGS
ncbi:TadE/TadG family type IV pilus assembly protein [Yoonia sp.]|uniref:TadE/TadG family type IV pilus assembly protein n=1 Tax=Yoonia sp. TaxID=2212373 RepID=UPI003A4E28DC